MTAQMTLNDIIEQLSSEADEYQKPIPNFIEGERYVYHSSLSSPFDKPFIFEVLEDKHDTYLIKIMDNYEYELAKDFDLIEAVNTGMIEKIS
jgi:hypothetical protein